MSKCGICNNEIDPDENWTETDCVICEDCSQREDWDLLDKRLRKLFWRRRRNEF